MLGYIYTLNGKAIYWKSFKQHIMADFTCDVEYILTSDATKEAVWLQKFINELRVAPSLDGSILLYCNSTGTIAQTKESKSHQGTKHILPHYHLVWKIMDRGNIELQKIDRKENLTNPFTKALGVKEFEDYKSKMGIWYCTDWL